MTMDAAIESHRLYATAALTHLGAPSGRHLVAKDVLIQARVESAIADEVEDSAENSRKDLPPSQHVEHVGALRRLHEEVEIGVGVVFSARGRSEGGEIGESSRLDDLPQHRPTRRDRLARMHAVGVLPCDRIADRGVRHAEAGSVLTLRLPVATW